MKYIVNNQQLFNVIYKFIDKELKGDNITYQYGTNYDTDETDYNIIQFYGDKYMENEQDELTFEYVKKEYYENIPKRDWDLKEKWYDKAPILEQSDYRFRTMMDSFFGDNWKPVFEQWFRDNYPNYPVKTFLYP